MTVVTLYTLALLPPVLAQETVQKTMLQNTSKLSAQIQLAPEVSESIHWNKRTQMVLQLQSTHLQTLFKSIPASDDVTLHHLSFKPQTREYHVDMTASGDRFKLIIQWSHPKQLTLGIADNWIPTGLILGKLKEKLEALLKPLSDYGLKARIDIKNTGGKNKLQIRISNQNPPLTGSGYIDPQGTWFMNLTQPLLSSQKGVQLKFKGLLNTTKNSVLKGDIFHNIQLHLSPNEIKPLSFAGEDLYRRLESLKGEINGKSTFKGSLNQGKWEGLFKANITEAQFKGHPYKNLHSYPIHWRFNVPYNNFFDFKVWPELPELKADRARLAQVKFNKGRLQYSIDGPVYLKALRTAVKQATQSVQQEVFVFYTGDTTRQLARLYLLKAAGLQENKNKITPDIFAPQGITFEIMHNHALSQKGAAKVNALFDNEHEQLLKTLTLQGFTQTQLNLYTKRIQQHLKLRALTRGAIKINHRKQVIIDKNMAFVGGFNLGDHYLSERGFHDIMYAITGPILSPLQNAFQHNWQALAQDNPFKPLRLQNTPANLDNPLVSDTINLNLLATSHKQAFFTPEMALLLHDHDQNLIQPAILKLIQEAKHTLRLEQAYFNHPQVIDALKAAKARGVNIEIIVSYYNDEGMFERLNLANMLEIKTAKGNGNVKCWLYKGKNKNKPANRKNPAYMVHTKYISADEKEAIVGSTNLIPRSLQSPFYGLEPEHYALSPAFFNEEIAIWLKDRQTVTALDQDLIKNDAEKRSVEINAKEMQELIQDRGGKWKLLADRLKGLLS